MKTIEQYSLQARIENAAVSYAAYIGKMIWPANMAIFYPHPGDTLAAWQVAGAGLLIACITALLLFVLKIPYPTTTGRTTTWVLSSHAREIMIWL